MQMPQLDDEPWEVSSSNLRTFLRGMPPDVQAFENIFAYANEEERATIEMPSEFVTAWLHVLSGMMLASEDSGSWFINMNKAKSLISGGVQKIVQASSNKNLLDDAAVLPMDITSLIMMELLRDQVGKADDIAETYSQFLSFLVCHVHLSSAPVMLTGRRTRI